ncbi:MAG: 3-deoxy-D-manno-octulosonic acid transferase [Candidatus Gorgyraea atricola]|nr:3-deoxy-D-manno-octulosonic acid transferase [Candidatus Gorgyraea atricola]
MASRFGILSKRLRAISSRGKVIWIHAVSVGEMKAASILAPLLREKFPSHKIIFSSVTHTGNKVAKTVATPEEEVFYLPFDLSFITNKVVKIIKPELFLCLETELWPNLISSLYRFNAKIILVNGRISNRSYIGYKRIRLIVSRLLRKFSLILMQSDEDAARVLDLGAPKERIFTVGNLKFDLLLLGPGNRRHEIRDKLGIAKEEILLVAGSTHKGEEDIILDCFLRLKEDHKNIKLLLAPRHVERTQEIENLLAKFGLESRKYSRDKGPHTKIEDFVRGRQGTRDKVLVLDVIGELKSIYSAADIVFIGGSLVKKGGQNPIEPAALSRPVIFGKYMFNFRDAAKSFLENKGAIQIQDKDELYSSIKLLLDDPAEKKRLGANAKHTVDKNSGSSQRTIDLILPLSIG